ncbi:hypothetical protein J6590_029764 [Homalodisca vitripennis]|nr:hypothetical protein J6590_029764 [Homalodisca vitripennis]
MVDNARLNYRGILMTAQGVSGAHYHTMLREDPNQPHTSGLREGGKKVEEGRESGTVLLSPDSPATVR